MPHVENENEDNSGKYAMVFLMAVFVRFTPVQQTWAEVIASLMNEALSKLAAIKGFQQDFKLY